MKKHCIFWILAAMLFAGCSTDDPTPTPPPPPAEVDLSARGTANCYMVSGPGDYSFDATVMGNGVATERAPAVTLAPVAAALVWQDAPGLLSEVTLHDGRVSFTAGEGGGEMPCLPFTMPRERCSGVGIFGLPTTIRTLPGPNSTALPG